MATLGLSDEQRNQFHRDGYLVVPNFLTPDEVEAMLQRSKVRWFAATACGAHARIADVIGRI